jgi:hypothetical protein
VRRSLVILALACVLQAACTPSRDAVSSLTSPSARPYTAAEAAEIVVPNVDGFDLPEARASLVSAGLGVFPVYLASEDVPQGTVLWTSPAHGVNVDASTFVEVSVSAGPEPPGGITWVAILFKHHRRAFVGNYRGPSSGAVVAISSDAERGRWQQELEAASEGRSFRLVQCEKTPSELRRIQRQLLPLVESGELEGEGVSGWGVQPRTCSVVLQGLLRPSTIERICALYGDAVMVVDGVPPATALG